MESLFKFTVKRRHHILCRKIQSRKFILLPYPTCLVAILFSLIILLTGCGDQNVPEGGTIVSLADPTPPNNTTTGRIINTGAIETTATNGHITISATDALGVTGYCAKENPATPILTDPCWERIVSTTSYLAMVPFTLSAGNGTKTVYVWFRDGEGSDGDISDAVSDDIDLTSSAEYTSVAGGTFHSIAVDSSGGVWGWGGNSYGQVGDGTTSQRNNPVKVKNNSDLSDLTGAIAVASGDNHSLALLDDGTVWAWGLGGSGQLGDGTSTQREAAVQVITDLGADLTGIIAIAAGGYHSLAVKDDGTLWAWGRNDYGQLGNGTGGPSSRATKVKVDASTDFIIGTTDIAIAGGASYSLALKDDGTVWAWGRNTDAQLGDGTYTNRFYPVQVRNNDGSDFNFGDSTIMDAGRGHNIVLKVTDGTIWTWGDNSRGELGVGMENGYYYRKSTYPVQVKNDDGSCCLSGITDIDAGLYHNLAIDSDGTLWAWGYNTNRQLGSGSGTSPTRLPVKVLNGASSGDADYLGDNPANPVIAVAGGSSHSLALKQDGTVWTWGWNWYGQLGDNTRVQRATPVQVLKGASLGDTTFLGDTNPVIAIGAGSGHSLAVLSDGSVLAWGSNSSGELGDNNSGTNSWLPVYVLKNSDLSQLNIGTTGIEIDGGASYSLALDQNGEVWTWGSDAYGNLGDGVPGGSRSTAAQVLGEGGTGTLTDISSISAGHYGTALALNGNGNIVWAWGNNWYGQLGNGTEGTSTNESTPIRVKDSPGTSDLSGVSSIAEGYGHSFVVKTDQSPWGWGENFQGQLGDGTIVEKLYPVIAKNHDGSPFSAIDIAAGGSHGLAITGDGRVWAWGQGNIGQLGVENTSFAATPSTVKNTDQSDFPPSGVATAISAGSVHSLAIVDDGGTKTAWGWGGNYDGQLGDGGTTHRYHPVIVENLDTSDFVTDSDIIVAGRAHTLAIKGDLSPWAWGSNNYGEIGDGTSGGTNDRHNPTSVTLLPVVVDVADGGYHTHAIRGGKQLMAMGWHGYGQTGAWGASDLDLYQPNPVLDSESQPLLDVSGIAAGFTHSIAFKDDGTVWAWGRNNFGQLGYGMDSQNDDPIADRQKDRAVQVLDETGLSPLENPVAISAGGEHSLSINSDGTILAWGRDEEGQLGNITIITHSNLPVQVDQGASTGDAAYLGDNPSNPVIAVTAGFHHSLALKADGTVWSWGENDVSQLGDGTSGVGTNKNTPVQVVDLTNIITISAGAFHSVALRNDGTVWAWGYNGYGQLGDGTTIDSSIPVQVMDEGGIDFLADIIDIAAGQLHTVVMKNNGASPVSVWAWGSNSSGQLGNNSSTDSNLPVQVVGQGGTGFLEDIISIHAGAYFTMALKNDWSMVLGWGEDFHGQLGEMGDQLNSVKSHTTPIRMDI